MKKYFVISTSIDLVRVAPEKVVFISSDGNYSTLMQANGESRVLTYQLGQVADMISAQLGSEGKVFIRVGKSLIINYSYIYYINIPKQRIILSDMSTFSHSLSASKEALKKVKDFLDQEAK